MAVNTIEAKQHAHQLLDQLSPGQLAAVVHLLETMISPEEDGDTLSNAEHLAISESDECLKHNQPIAHEDVLAEFGLTMADWKKMGREPTSEEPRRNAQTCEGNTRQLKGIEPPVTRLRSQRTHLTRGYGV
jgi:hypothetical protein